MERLKLGSMQLPLQTPQHLHHMNFAEIPTLRSKANVGQGVSLRNLFNVSRMKVQGGGVDGVSPRAFESHRFWQRRILIWDNIVFVWLRPAGLAVV